MSELISVVSGAVGVILGYWIASKMIKKESDKEFAHIYSILCALKPNPPKRTWTQIIDKLIGTNV